MTSLPILSCCISNLFECLLFSICCAYIVCVRVLLYWSSHSSFPFLCKRILSLLFIRQKKEKKICLFFNSFVVFSFWERGGEGGSKRKYCKEMLMSETIFSSVIITWNPTIESMLLLFIFWAKGEKKKTKNQYKTWSEVRVWNISKWKKTTSLNWHIIGYAHTSDDYLSINKVNQIK